jgi:predicted transcriptional regulator
MDGICRIMARKEVKTKQGNQDNSYSLVTKKLLGSLECEVMECMWESNEATVQHVLQVISRRRPLAYTTIMTVMVHLVDKGLLTRNSEGKKYLYKVAQSREEFVHAASQKMVRQTLSDFGDMAIAGFMGEISRVKPEKLHELRDLLREALDEKTAPE